MIDQLIQRCLSITLPAWADHNPVRANSLMILYFSQGKAFVAIIKLAGMVNIIQDSDSQEGLASTHGSSTGWAGLCLALGTDYMAMSRQTGHSTLACNTVIKLSYLADALVEVANCCLSRAFSPRRSWIVS